MASSLSESGKIVILEEDGVIYFMQYTPAHKHRQADRQTGRQTDRQTDRQTHT